jgi:MFS family permease
VSIFPGWKQVAVAAITQGIAAASVMTAYSVVAVPLQHAFQPSRTVLMLTITVVMLATSLLSPPIGAAMDKYSVRRLMLAGAGFLVAGFLALSLTTSMVQVFVVYAALMAAGNVLLGPLAASALLGRWFTRRRGLAMGIAALGISVGGLILPPLIQGLITTFEWRWGLRILSGLFLVVLLPAILLLTIDRPALLKLYPDGDKVPPEGAQHTALPLTTTGAVLRDRSFWLITITTGVVFSGGSGLLSNMAPMAIDKGISASHAALLISCLSVGSFGGKSLFAAVADHIDLRISLGVCLLGMALGLLFFWHAEGYTFLLAGAFLEGIALGAVVPLWSVLVTRSFGAQNVGRVMGLMTLAEMPLLLLSPPLYGLIFDNTGSYEGAFMLFIGLSAASIVLLPRIRTYAMGALARPAMS